MVPKSPRVRGFRRVFGDIGVFRILRVFGVYWAFVVLRAFWVLVV
jgi:hypothetical protein